ncbi:MAG: hypothetical protein M1825_000169 [Sarcosagium campestre]|nr:MAG: hypothetical protein M1825_000169 [Sarcosagium campestre]
MPASMMGSAPIRPGPSSRIPQSQRDRKRRRATIFDAIAGRLTRQQILTPHDNSAVIIDTVSRHGRPIAPDEALARFKNAPDRFEDAGYCYFAHERLAQPSDPSVSTASLNKLPDSDMLKAVHSYASDFYARAEHDTKDYDWGSLDETALLAVGVLLEEMAREEVAGTADLVLVEPEEDGKGKGKGKG